VIWALIVALLLPWQSTPNYQRLGPCGQQIADSINSTRVEHGRKPLRINWKMHRFAYRWSAQMRDDGVLRHSFGPYGENVGTANDCLTLIQAWWDSEPHADNALTRWYTEMGPGSAGQPGRIWGAVEFR
jgi:uncharacterized protein YkwD